MPRLSSLVLKTLAGLGITLPAGGLSWGSILNAIAIRTFSNPSPSITSWGSDIAMTDTHTVVGRMNFDYSYYDYFDYYAGFTAPDQLNIQGGIFVYDNETGTLLHSNTPSVSEWAQGYGQSHFGAGVAINDTHYAAMSVWGETCRLYVYDLATGAEIWNKLVKQTSSSYDIMFNIYIAGTYVIEGSGNSQYSPAAVRVHDLTTGADVVAPVLPAGYTGNTEFGRNIVCSGDYLVVSSKNVSGTGAVHIYRMEANFPHVGTISSPSTQNYFGFAPWWLAQYDAGIVDAANRYSIQQTLAISSGSIAITSLLEDVGLANNLGKLYVYDIETQTLLWTKITPESAAMWPMHIRANANSLVLGNGNGPVYIYNPTTGALEYTLNDAHVKVEEQFNISEHRFAGVTANNTVSLYNLYDDLR